ncbi:DUF5695 domain-containing protein [Mangrovibacterium lignilyticum]|uniref:DUF5695 domain-containing protein n=1 Tax=Mangrovibacterium lignilyticum TaxID=2668052 RepID=UPI0013D4F44D|nr:DUF5695 domain-containing protein [Mangrovibacterium lignilyticum]
MLKLEEGFSSYHTPTLGLELVNSSQTVAKLEATDYDNFDLAPYEWLEKRDADGFYHLGDINLSVRNPDSLSWTKYSSAAKRQPVKAITSEDSSVLAAADLKNTFPDDFPLQLTRFWQKKDDHLVLKFQLKNPLEHAVEIGALGIPLIFDNNFDHKHLDEAHAENVFFDPYIGEDAGYLQVARLNGEGPVMLVLPYGHSPFEAYRPLLDDPTNRSFTFEGFHEWMIYSKAYADNEWKGSEQWNEPRSKVLAAGETIEFGLEFVLADSIKAIEKTLIRHDRPVVVGVPGYVLPEDVNGNLFIKSNKSIAAVQVEPKGALEVSYDSQTKGNWSKYRVKGAKWGRARLTLVYDDKSIQTINYKIIKPEAEVVADNGHFLTTKQWYVNDDDLFGRSPSVITYDYEAKKQLTEDRRAWVAGLSDEGGAGAWLNAIMKQLVEPNKEEIAKLEDFVNLTIVGGIQSDEGPGKYGVRKSMFYYEPDSMPSGTYSDTVDYSSWSAWPKKEAISVGRSYNYPHVTAAYWVMYRLARNHVGLTTQQDWSWYLEQSFHTAMAMVNLAPYYAQFGQMEGSVFLFLLKDLQAEGFSDMAAELEEAMKTRATHWASLNYPFGSEMPWDSTGQEEVYMWSHYFGFSEKSLVTINAILAYMPTIPHWAYNGNARRYWDFLYGGKLSRIERMIHHYGSPLNAIPVLTEYRDHPEDLYLLRVGYGGLMGALSNITEDGFAPCASHSFPSTLKNDGISGDYGSGYYGYAVNSASYITHDDELGWLAFGGNLSEKGPWIETAITTASKSKIYISPAKAWITLTAGAIEKVSYNKTTGEINLTLLPADTYTPNAYLLVEKNHQKVAIKGDYRKNERGDFIIPLKKSSVTISI